MILNSNACLLRGVILLTSVAACAVGSPASENSGDKPDKSSFHLFRPTPTEQMRELSADRPDKTDSPMTVDAGHVQVEMDFVNMTLDRPRTDNGKARYRSVDLAPMNVKLGVLNNLDFQVTYTAHRWETTEESSTGSLERKQGFDGITPRLKWNLIGNDGGFFALALLPFIKAPLTQSRLSNDRIEGGLAIPYSFDVPGWDIGLQTAFHWHRNESRPGYHTEFDNSLSVGHSLIGPLSLSVEFFGSVSTERDQGWVGTVDTWLTYQVSPNLRLDAGVYIGVTPSAPDWHPFLGMTCRY